MAAKVYDVGDAVELTATFKVDGEETDPTTVNFKVRKPNGQIETFSWPSEDSNVHHSSTGNFLLLYFPQTKGFYRYRIEGIGLAYGTEEGTFRVRYSEFTT